MWFGGCKKSCTYVECGLGGVRSHVHMLSVVWGDIKNLHLVDRGCDVLSVVWGGGGGCKKTCTCVECGFGGVGSHIHVLSVVWGDIKNLHLVDLGCDVEHLKL